VDIDLNIHLNMLDINIWSMINDQNLKIITQLNLSNTEFIFRRRPAISSALYDFQNLTIKSTFFCCSLIRFHLNLTSFNVTGFSPDTNKPQPIIVQPILRNKTKLLQVEFQINPTEKDSGYRLQFISQSLEIKYHSVGTNHVIEINFH